MVTTNDEALWRSMWAYKDHGKSYAAVYERDHPPGFRWLHESFGTNWRMTEMQAAIGRIQLRRLREWTARRHRHARRLAEVLAEFNGPEGVLRLPKLRCPSGCGWERAEADVATGCCAEDTGCVHAQYKFYAYVRPERLAPGWTRDRILDAINAEGVPCYVGSCSEIYREKAFDGTPWRPLQPLPNARDLGETSLMWLVHPTLSDDEIDRMAAVSASVLRRSSDYELHSKCEQDISLHCVYQK